MDLVGQTLSGKYLVERKIGMGGFAVVYEGKDIVLEIPVALKVLLPQWSRDDAFVKRFLGEAQKMANMIHDNIIRVIGFEQDQGSHYMVMDYFPSQDLRDILKSQGKLSLKQALDIAIQVADGLEYAHGQGVIHRDIKPGNILVNDKGEVKITDFGIAKAKGEASLTLVGTALGTVNYMAPEQAMGKPIDPRNDLYALGVVLYEMITGTIPRQKLSGLTLEEKLEKIKYDPKEISLIFPSPLPESLRQCLQNLVIKDPHLRIQDARTLGNVLRQCRDELPSFHPEEAETILRPIPPGEKPSSRWGPMPVWLVKFGKIIGLLASFVLVFGLAYWGWKEGWNQQEQREKIERAYDALQHLQGEYEFEYKNTRTGLEDMKKRLQSVSNDLTALPRFTGQVSIKETFQTIRESFNTLDQEWETFKAAYLKRRDEIGVKVVMELARATKIVNDRESEGKTAKLEDQIETLASIRKKFEALEPAHLRPFSGLVAKARTDLKSYEKDIVEWEEKISQIQNLTDSLRTLQEKYVSKRGEFENRVGRFQKRIERISEKNDRASIGELDAIGKELSTLNGRHTDSVTALGEKLKEKLRVAKGLVEDPTLQENISGLRSIIQELNATKTRIEVEGKSQFDETLQMLARTKNALVGTQGDEEEQLQEETQTLVQSILEDANEVKQDTTSWMDQLTSFITRGKKLEKSSNHQDLKQQSQSLEEKVERIRNEFAKKQILRVEQQKNIQESIEKVVKKVQDYLQKVPKAEPTIQPLLLEIDQSQKVFDSEQASQQDSIGQALVRVDRVLANLHARIDELQGAPGDPTSGENLLAEIHQVERDLQSGKVMVDGKMKELHDWISEEDTQIAQLEGVWNPSTLRQETPQHREALEEINQIFDDEKIVIQQQAIHVGTAVNSLGDKLAVLIKESPGADHSGKIHDKLDHVQELQAQIEEAHHRQIESVGRGISTLSQSISRLEQRLQTVEKLKTLLMLFRVAYEQADMERLSQLSELTEGRKQYLKLVYGTFSEIQTRIEVRNINDKEAEVDLVHEKMVNRQTGLPVQITPITERIHLTLPHEGNHWGKILWEHDTVS